jgi:hypothetical protein
MGLLGGGGNKKADKKMNAVLDYASQKSLEEADTMKNRIQAGAEAQWGVLGMLGQPGTYSSPTGGAPGVGPGGITSPYGAGGGTSAAGGGAGGPGAGLDYKAGSLFYDSGPKESDKAGKKSGLTQGQSDHNLLDPEKFTQMVSKMPVSQIISRQVAEAQGLTDPSSPFRQSMEQSIKNPIIEAGAETLRESQRQIKNQMAKGGSARRAALADAQNMMAIESSNRQVSQQMWQSNLQFESWVRDYQRTTVNAAMAFTNGLGVQQYTNAMNSASQFMVQTAIPSAVQYKEQAYQIALKNKKKGIGEMILGGVMMVGGAIASIYGGGAIGAPMMAQGAGMLLGKGGEGAGTAASGMLSSGIRPQQSAPVTFGSAGSSEIPGAPSVGSSYFNPDGSLKIGA